MLNIPSKRYCNEEQVKLILLLDLNNYKKNIMKKLTFKKKDVKVNYGIPSKLKIIAVSVLISGATLGCVEESDDCRSTSTDYAPVADLGAQQDPNSNCDSD